MVSPLLMVLVTPRSPAGFLLGVCGLEETQRGDFSVGWAQAGLPASAVSTPLQRTEGMVQHKQMVPQNRTAHQMDRTRPNREEEWLV